MPQPPLSPDEKLTRDLAQVDSWFTYHAPTDAQRLLLEQVRDDMRVFAIWFVSHVADSRERAIALTELRKAVMSINQAIIFGQP